MPIVIQPTTYASLPSDHNVTPLSVQQFRENARKLGIDVRKADWDAARGDAADSIHLSTFAESERHASAGARITTYITAGSTDTQEGVNRFALDLLTLLSEESIDAHGIWSTNTDANPHLVWDLLMMAPHKCAVTDVATKGLKLDARIAGALSPHLLTPPLIEFI